MKKKLLGVLLSAAMLGTMLVGCGSAPSTADNSKTEDTEKTDDSQQADNGADADADADGDAKPAGDLTIEIVSKGFQHQFWQSVLKGAEKRAKELGVKINFVGPNSESDIADQVQMLTNAINAAPNAIALAALDTDACLDAISQAQSANIPIVGFDSGVPGAPDGAIVANAATDNYNAGAMAAEEAYKAALKDRIANASGPVRIGVMGQDATSESIISRGLGFVDKMIELAEGDNKTVSVEGNDKYVTDSTGETKDGADVILEIVVPASVTSELSAVDCQTLLNKPDIIAIYGSNQHSGDAMVTGDENLNKFGTGDDQVIGIAFDSGKVIKDAVKNGKFIGAITQAPVAMGEAVVQLCVNAATGEEVKDVDTGCQWYTAENIDSEEISQNLYD